MLQQTPRRSLLFRRPTGFTVVWISALSISAVLLATGCETPGNDYYVSSPVADGGGGETLGTLLIAPLNFDATPPSSWVDGTEQVAELVRVYVSATGRQVEVLSLREVIEQWGASARAVGGIRGEEAGEVDQGRYEQARAELARRLLAAHEADAVVMPTLTLRPGKYSGRSMKWDGVTRKLRFEMHKSNYMPTRLSGGGSGTSLRVTIYDEAGRKLFERHGGIEPTVFVYCEGDRFWVRERNDLFEDNALLRDGIHVAFTPFIAPL